MTKHTPGPVDIILKWSNVLTSWRSRGGSVRLERRRKLYSAIVRLADKIGLAKGWTRREMDYLRRHFRPVVHVPASEYGCGPARTQMANMYSAADVSVARVAIAKAEGRNG